MCVQQRTAESTFANVSKALQNEKAMAIMTRVVVLAWEGGEVFPGCGIRSQFSTTLSS